MSSAYRGALVLSRHCRVMTAAVVHLESTLIQSLRSRRAPSAKHSVLRRRRRHFENALCRQSDSTVGRRRKDESGRARSTPERASRRKQGARLGAQDRGAAYSAPTWADPGRPPAGALGNGRRRSRGRAGADDPDRGKPITPSWACARLLAVESDHPARRAGTIGFVTERSCRRRRRRSSSWAEAAARLTGVAAVDDPGRA